MTSVTELEQLVDADPAAAAKSAAPLIQRHRSDGDVDACVRALACLGRARRLLGEIQLAEVAFVEAIELADEHGRAELAADGHVGLAALRWNQGRTDDVEFHLRRAEEHGSPRTITKALLQRAGIAQLLGRFDEALSGYSAVIPDLEAGEDWLDLARVLSNRAVIHSNRAQADRAIEDLDRAAALFDAAGQPFHAAQVVHNLGATYARMGDLPRAMQQLDRAVDDLVRIGHDAHEVELVRLQTLIAAGLVIDARAAAVELGERLRATGNVVRAAETDLLAAVAARLGGDFAGAEIHAARAVEFFAGQESTGWSRAAELERLLARAGRAERSNPIAEDALKLAVAVAAAGDVLGEARSLTLAARMTTDPGAAMTAADRVGTIASEVDTFECRLLARSAAAAACLLAGNDAGALAQAQAAAQDLEAHRSTLGSSDAQAHAAAHVEDLIDLGLELTVRAGSADETLAWISRRRRAGLGPPGGASRPDVAAALEQVRRAEARLADATRSGGGDDDMVEAVRQAERSYRRSLLALEGGGVIDDVVASVDSVRAGASGGEVVAFDVIGGRLVAVVIGSSRAVVADVADAAMVTTICGLAGRSAAAMVVGDAPVRRARRAAFDAAIAQLDELVITPLRLGDSDLIVVPCPAVADLPWGALPTLAGRRLSVVPTPTWIAPPASGPTPSGGGVAVNPERPVVVVAGPDLELAERESAAVAAQWSAARVLTGPDATAAAVRAHLSTASVVHLVTHGSFRSDNPLWSALHLHDGRFTAYELESLDSLPDLVVLSSCDTGRTGSSPGSGLLGVASTFLRLGVENVIAAVAPMPDTAGTVSAMTELHRLLASGAAPAGALALARAAAADGELASVVCFSRPG